MFRFFKAVILSLLVTGSAMAWPTKEITIIVPYPAGGASDQLARIIQKNLAESLSVPIVVLNIPGGDNMVAIHRVLNSPNDNHTFIQSISDFVLSPMLQNTDLYNQFTAVNIQGTNPYVFFGNKYSSVEQFSQEINNKEPTPLGIIGLNSVTKLWIDNLTNSPFLPVPYKGTPQLVSDVMGNHVQFGIIGINGLFNYFSSNTLIPLAVSGKTRLESFPDVPTFEEVGMAGPESLQWYALFARQDTDPVALQTMSSLVHQIVSTDTEFKSYIPRGLSLINLDLPKSEEFRQTQVLFLKQLIEKSK